MIGVEGVSERVVVVLVRRAERNQAREKAGNRLRELAEERLQDAILSLLLGVVEFVVEGDGREPGRNVSPQW